VPQVQGSHAPCASHGSGKICEVLLCCSRSCSTTHNLPDTYFITSGVIVCNAAPVKRHLACHKGPAGPAWPCAAPHNRVCHWATISDVLDQIPNCLRGWFMDHDNIARMFRPPTLSLGWPAVQLYSTTRTAYAWQHPTRIYQQGLLLT
jgi:hypothetical protein